MRWQLHQKLHQFPALPLGFARRATSLKDGDRFSPWIAATRAGSERGAKTLKSTGTPGPVLIRSQVCTSSWWGTTLFLLVAVCILLFMGLHISNADANAMRPRRRCDREASRERAVRGGRTARATSLVPLPSSCVDEELRAALFPHAPSSSCLILQVENAR